MRTFDRCFATSDPKSRSCLWNVFVAVCLIFAVYFIGNEFLGKQYDGRLRNWKVIAATKSANSTRCKNTCRPPGSEALPQGIVAKTSNFEMRPLWNASREDDKPKRSKSLLALAVGIKQKEVVNQIVRKFPQDDFVVMLFHYDGILDQWRNFPWHDRAIHVSAANQTKWWFAKRFLHPDIVADYNYIFLWDEDLGVENFDPGRYLSIVKKEGLEISQPALDPTKSEVYHPITARRGSSTVHRRMYKFKGRGRCDKRSTSPPCVGWVEMMAPVFSRAAWQCTWYMIQNDLIHAWGLDFQLGYCAQGDRTKNVGVVDSEYVVHLALPTLGMFNGSEVLASTKLIGSDPKTSLSANCAALASPEPHKVDSRPQVRMQSYMEMQMFRKRWKNATEEDKCWVDPFQHSTNQIRR